MLHLQAELAGTEDLGSGLNLSLDDSTQVISEATHHGSSPVASLLPKRGSSCGAPGSCRSWSVRAAGRWKINEFSR